MSFSPGELYKLSRSIDNMINIIKKLNLDSDIFSDIYRYSKVVDISPRGFNCTNAVSLHRSINTKPEDLKKIKEIYFLLSKIIELNNIEDIESMVMEEKDL